MEPIVYLMEKDGKVRVVWNSVDFDRLLGQGWEHKSTLNACIALENLLNLGTGDFENIKNSLLERRAPENG